MPPCAQNKPVCFSRMRITLTLVAAFSAWCYAAERSSAIHHNIGIRIVAQDQPLREILDDVNQKSGIVFDVSARVKESRTTATISARTWPEAIKHLLKGYNRVGIWNEEGELERIMVLSPVGKAPPLSRKARLRTRGKKAPTRQNARQRQRRGSKDKP